MRIFNGKKVSHQFIVTIDVHVAAWLYLPLLEAFLFQHHSVTSQKQLSARNHQFPGRSVEVAR